jgi:hypothetical protein
VSYGPDVPRMLCSRHENKLREKERENLPDTALPLKKSQVQTLVTAVPTFAELRKLVQCRRSAFAALPGRLCYDCTLQTERESKRWLNIFRAKN